MNLIRVIPAKGGAMLSVPVASILVGVVLLTFVWVGFRAAASTRDVEEYTVARNSQGPWPLGLSFLASGMGAWILFAPPEVGAGIGLIGVVGYALGAGGPIVAFALLGRPLRRLFPRGHSITEFARIRYGRTFFTYVGLVSIAYMLFFVTAELTAIGGVTAILTDLDARAVIVAVAVLTLAYTAYGGLRASLRTDAWQAWLLIGLLAVAGIAMLVDLPSVGDAWVDSGLLGVDRLGLEVALTLVIAVVAANLFHQGYWQRVWAATDDGSLARGATIGAIGTIPLVLAVGALGILASGAGVDLGSPPVPFFALVSGLPQWVAAIVLVAGVSLVASSVDTLENALASLVVVERPRWKMTQARLVTIGLMLPAVVIAVQGYSVLRLFLIADLLCAATVVPILLGLWPKATPSAALSGSLAGLLGAVAPGFISSGSLIQGIEAASFPGAVPTLPPFLWSLVASAGVSLAVSLVQDRYTDLSTLGMQPAGTESG